MYELNPSVKHHTIIGAIIGIWIFLFIIFIRPFEHGDMNTRIWFYVGLGFSLAVLVSYIILSFVQRMVYFRLSKWSIGLEALGLIFFYLLYSISTYLFYRSPILNGSYGVFEFLTTIMVPSALVSAPVIVFARRYALKFVPKKATTITITGENKLDVLKIQKNDLVCVSNSQNYVEIFFLDTGELKTKLIRTSLKKIQQDFEFLIQVHRSHLINPSHFRAWKNQNTISLTKMELPVSKSYKERLLSL